MSRIAPLEQLKHPTAVSIALLEQAAEQLNGSQAHLRTVPAKPRSQSQPSLWRLNKSRVQRGLPRLEALPEQLQEKPAVDPCQVVEQMLELLGMA